MAVVRRVKLTDDQYEKIDESLLALTLYNKMITQMLWEGSQKSAKEEKIIWDSIDVLGSVDKLKLETASVNHITREIIVEVKMDSDV